MIQIKLKETEQNVSPRKKTTPQAKCFIFLALGSFLALSCGLTQLPLAAPSPTTMPTQAPTQPPTLPPSPTSLPPTASPTSTPTSVPTDTPAPTPIGGGVGKIVFVKSHQITESEALTNLCVINVDGTNLTCLTDNDDPQVVYSDPKWSPDGKRILFSRIEDVGELLGISAYWKSELYVMNADGTEVEKISPIPQYEGNINPENYLVDEKGDWSPDGQSIVFASNRHSFLGGNDLELYRLDLSTQQVTQLTDAAGESYHPVWSPDGTRIAFMSDRSGNWEIYVMNADGSQVEQLTQNLFSDRFPSWSPDGTKIIFHSDRDGNVDLYVLSLDTLSETRLTTDPAVDATARWSPDGQWVVFSSDRDGDFDLYIMSLDGATTLNLTHKEGSDDEEAVAHWSPGG